ncbi:hypothetical protein Hypma_004249 [Hypsizygus marmoreus]|uniref:F-box domain-containing protein n=1 Tax=Hypsizygus marmoreus TaxID=39966 RepID=A0A369J746_HYPMA|nr:hypothetical protein Hypma_004249 [Hypsizygus marmoreus]
MPPDLPQELLDKVIDNLRHDSEALKHCALASRSFLFHSQSHVFATVRICSLTRCNHLSALFDMNPALAGHVRVLRLVSLYTWACNSSELSAILRMMIALRALFMSSIELLPLNWGTLSPELIDAFIGAFGNPSLQSLEISNVTGIPVTTFHRNIKLAHFLLTNVTFVGYGDVDYENPDAVPLELRLPYGLEIRRLCLGRMRNAASLVPQLLNVTRRSLRALQFRQWLLHAGRRPSSHFTYDFKMLPALQSLEFYVVAVMDVRFNLKPLLRMAFQNIIDFVLANPTAARIERFRICFIASHPVPRPSEPPAWSFVSYALETMDLWEELDRIIDVRKEAVSAVFRLEIDLASSNEERQPEELLAHREAWKEKIVRKLPLASRRGVLMTEVIPDVEM